MTRRFALYYADTSSCSVMIRMMLEMRDRAELPDDELDPMPMNLARFEQIDEDYLIQLNWKGHVPVLTDKQAEKPIPETLTITRYLRPILSSLFPSEHEERIDDLLVALHAHNFWSLTYAMRPDGKEPDRTRGEGIIAAIRSRIADPEISDEYRAALGRKLKHHQAVKMDALEPEYAQNEHRKLKSFLADVKTEADQHRGPWLFGQRYSALDAQLTVLLHRLRKVNKASYIDDAGLSDYADRLLAVDAWTEVGQEC